MLKAKDFLKYASILFLVVGLMAGCGSSKNTTAVDPADLDELTNGFTEGSGKITQEVIDGVLGTVDPVNDMAGAVPMPSKISSSKQGFDIAFKALKQIDMPILNNFMDLYLNYAILGVPFDPSGTVDSITGSSKLFNPRSLRLTGADLGEDGPTCLYIEGLPTSIENMIKGETVDPATVASDIEDFIKSFNVTFGFEGECVILQDGDPVDYEMIGQGSINIKGGVKVSDTKISSNLTITSNNLKLDNYVAPTTKTEGLNLVYSTVITGSMYFELNSVLDASNFTLDFLASANEFTVTSSGPDKDGVETIVYHKIATDGAIAIAAESPTIPFNPADFETTTRLFQFSDDDIAGYLTLLAAALPYIPDICNLSVIVVVDMTIAFVAEPTAAEITWDILWGMKFATTADTAFPACTNSTGEFVFVYFVDEKTFFLVAYTDPGLSTYAIILKGSPGDEVVIVIDAEGNTCEIQKWEDSAFDFSGLSCTWTDDYENDVFTLGFLLGGIFG